MTGELCDCYETKREGVNAIIKAVRSASHANRIRIWSTDGVFVDSEEAKRDHLKVASANWHALATLAGQYVTHGPATLIDMGSTTTDVIPILDGMPIARGRTDAERLRYQELVYTGVRRTPVIALMTDHTAAELWRVAAELFATTLDVYLWRRMIADDESDTNTADHRPATRRHALARLARMFCSEIDEISEEQIGEFADFISRQQLRLLESAYDQTYRAIAARLEEGFRSQDKEPPRRPILCGSGEFLLRRFASSRSYMGEPISLADKWGDAVSACAPAYAVAVLAAESQ